VSTDRPRPSDRHLAVIGPTASGKSALVLELARRRGDCEIVTVDSMQVYRGMDIGTATPTDAEQAEVPHHLLDIVDPDDDYTVSRFQADCLAVLADIEDRGKRALLVGGTGLYLQAVVDDLEIPGRFPEVRAELEEEPDTDVLFMRLHLVDPTAAERIEPGNRRRLVRALEVTLGSGRPFSSYGPGLDSYPPSPFPVVGLGIDRPRLDQRIEQRYAEQLAAGFVAEVEGLLARPAGLSRTARQALGYAELIDHLEHGTPLDDAVEHAVRRTRRFARRQQRWFGRDPRVDWVTVDGTVTSTENALARLDGILGD
jgi:tRNA dimethylallyltransferase